MKIIKYSEYKLNESDDDFFENEKKIIIEKYKKINNDYTVFLALVSSQNWRGAPILPDIDTFIEGIDRLKEGGQKEFNYALENDGRMISDLQEFYPDRYKKLMRNNTKKDFNL